jgi:hypothetical protein
LCLRTTARHRERGSEAPQNLNMLLSASLACSSLYTVRYMGCTFLVPPPIGYLLQPLSITQPHHGARLSIPCFLEGNSCGIRRHNIQLSQYGGRLQLYGQGSYSGRSILFRRVIWVSIYILRPLLANSTKSSVPVYVCMCTLNISAYVGWRRMVY